MNKIIVSIILAICLVIGINKAAETIFHVEKPKKSAYQIAGVSSNTVEAVSTSSVSDASEDIMSLLASVKAADGEKVFKKCAACHSIAKGGGNKIGPALWSVLGRRAGSQADYKYSKAMIAYGKKWTFEEMNNFLIKPKDWIKGTKMSYVGLKKPEERAAVILYLNTNSDNPLSLQ